MTTKKSAPEARGTAKKLKLKKQTLKNLTVSNPSARAIKGGAATHKQGANNYF